MSKLPRFTEEERDAHWDDPAYAPSIEHLVDSINVEVQAALDLLERLYLEAGQLVTLLGRINERVEHPALEYWRRINRPHH